MVINQTLQIIANNFSINTITHTLMAKMDLYLHTHKKDSMLFTVVIFYLGEIAFQARIVIGTALIHLLDTFQMPLTQAQQDFIFAISFSSTKI